MQGQETNNAMEMGEFAKHELPSIGDCYLHLLADEDEWRFSLHLRRPSLDTAREAYGLFHARHGGRLVASATAAPSGVRAIPHRPAIGGCCWHLLADEDEWRVSLHLRRPSPDTAREVYALFHARHGRRLPQAEAIVRMVAWAGDRDGGVVRHVCGRLVRRNGGHTGVCVDGFSSMMHWASAVAPSRSPGPVLPGPPQAARGTARHRGRLAVSRRRRSHCASAAGCSWSRIVVVTLRHSILGSPVIRCARSLIRRYWPLPREHSWEAVLGDVLVQTVPDTCALVAATVCIEAQHRLEFERIHGAGTFSCKAAAPRKLLNACRRARVWDSELGACACDVLKLVRGLGGVRTTNAPPPSVFLLPLESWDDHRWCDLTPEKAARLLYERGPCVGSVWATALYDTFDAAVDDDAVYRGPPRDDRERHKREEDASAGLHGVVCYEYRFVGGELHIKVLDNVDAHGPTRWVHYDEFDYFNRLGVEPVHPASLLLRAREIRYPDSIPYIEPNG
ncbi:hypothetical protein ACP4OV_025525 [Aristida adscensionis]